MRSHSKSIEARRSAGDPLDLRKGSKDTAYRRKASGVKLVAAIEPTHHLSGGPRKPGIQRRIESLICLLNPGGEIPFVIPDNFCGTIRRTVIHNDVFEIGISLINQGTNGVFEVGLSIVDRSHHRDA